MYDELLVRIGSQNHRAFFTNGFYLAPAPTANLHKHNFSEVHVVAKGHALFSVDDTLFPLTRGNLMMVPRGMFHSCIQRDRDTVHTAFQIDCEPAELSVCSISPETVSDFIEAIRTCRQSDDYTRVAAYVSLFCSCFFRDKNLTVSPVIDYGFLIQEFFSLYYGQDIHLSDLANTLHLSPRQTERLVIAHTGNTFRDELISIRMNIANKLFNSSDLSLKKISQHVGYNSYAGFWKAMKKYELQRRCSEHPMDPPG